MRVLVVGSGGREHALASRLSEDEDVSEVLVAPGNGGTSELVTLGNGGVDKFLAAKKSVRNCALDPNDTDALVKLASFENVDLVVIGPEQPLVDGVSDALQAVGVPCFGPTKAAARLEGDKGFSKSFMREFGIPTAAFEVFHDPESAKEYIRAKNRPLVVKASGLAAGKGVVVSNTVLEALDAVDQIMGKRAFGDAGESIVIEERLSGQEVSYHVIADGTHYVPLAPAQDHKRAFDGDEGPNTGGMGAYSPPRIVTPQLQAIIHHDVVEPTLKGLCARNTPFRGVLFIGLMVEDNRVQVLEYNVRFGDPECQTLMARLGGSLFDLLWKAANGKLESGVTPVWTHPASLSVVIASGGYPGVIETGHPISGLEDAAQHARVFHGGTVLRSAGQGADENGSGHDPSGDAHRGLDTSGGRVLTVTGVGSDLFAARTAAYRAVDAIGFEGARYRSDIGHNDLPGPFERHKNA